MTTPHNPMASNQPAGYDGDANDWLMGGGVKSFSFNGPPPISAHGTVTEPPSKMQKRNFDTGDPEFWSDGSPRIMLKVVIQTDQRDPADPEDDGKRALYLENRKAHAVRDACKAAGVRGLEVGGTLTLTYTGDDLAAKQGRKQAPKNFSAQYVPPNPLDQVAPEQQQGGWNLPPQPAPQGYQAPPPQQYAPPAAPAGPPQSAPAAPAAPAGRPPVLDFLASKGMAVDNIPDEPTALMIARSYPDCPPQFK